MGLSLTTREIELAKSYIIWRSLIKALKKDLGTFNKGELVFSSVYASLAEDILINIEKELKKLARFSIRVQKTDQPTVWEVKVGTHQGFIEINRVELIQRFETYLIQSKGPRSSSG